MVRPAICGVPAWRRECAESSSGFLASLRGALPPERQAEANKAAWMNQASAHVFADIGADEARMIAPDDPRAASLSSSMPMPAR